ncbi:FBD-associated F-box protein At5g56370-like [Vicia villosa]|uniref:FBD-associated F-box protein At5g56370-like n=1 Tax=Vicia villosa TaxID=3911 RepID=UPI00273C2E10|nr:FBD-associated F-box protein At5g56370-like [Vicia villosa]
MADIISTLPDAILCHILSFLQTEQSVATSILSKRWNHLWLSVPTLCFKETVLDRITTSEFNDFVYSVLVSRDFTLPIKTFYLDVTYEFPVPCPIISITKWLNFVLQTRVEYLHLHINSWHHPPKLPLTILTCKTLVVLKLYGFSVKEVFSYSSVLLPSLKTLHLEYIRLPKLQDFIMFLSGCPILEDLRTFDVLIGSLNSQGLTSNEWKSFCLSKLTRADIQCGANKPYFPLKALHNTHSLLLRFLRVHYRNDSIPTFHNLTQLKLVSLNYNWRFLVKLLNHCPKLQRLDIDQADVDKKIRTKRDDRDDWVDPDFVPQCLSLHLTTCNLFNFLGLQGELLLVSYILRNAEVLQTMQISNVGQKGIRRLISSCPRASTTCQVTIINVSIVQKNRLKQR